MSTATLILVVAFGLSLAVLITGGIRSIVGWALVLICVALLWPLLR